MGALVARLREAAANAPPGCKALCVSVLLDRREKVVPMTISVTTNDGARRAGGNDSRYVEMVPLPLSDALSVGAGVWERMLLVASEVGLNPELLSDEMSRLIDRVARRFECTDDEVREIKKVAVGDQAAARMCFLALERDFMDQSGAVLKTSLPSIPEVADDRVRCGDCGGLNGNGACTPADQGRLGASWRYSPMQQILRRCGAFFQKGSEPPARLPQLEPSRRQAPLGAAQVKGAFKVGRR